MKLNCIVIEDEPLARKGIEGFISKVEFLNPTGSFPNPLPAIETLRTQKIDLIFLDIKMPEISGLDFLKTLDNPPAVIITTAYPNYAIQGFELNTTDYLLKPFSFERFLTAVNKVKVKALSEQNPTTDDYVFIKCENRFEKIFFSKILFVQAMENYVVIQTETNKYISYLTLKMIESYLPEKQFFKIHKSYIISIPHIDSIDGNKVNIGKFKIQFNRNNREKILNVILKDKLLKR